MPAFQVSFAKVQVQDPHEDADHPTKVEHNVANQIPNLRKFNFNSKCQHGIF